MMGINKRNSAHGRKQDLIKETHIEAKEACTKAKETWEESRSSSSPSSYTTR
jgi:hypothetical protein